MSAHGRKPVPASPFGAPRSPEPALPQVPSAAATGQAATLSSDATAEIEARAERWRVEEQRKRAEAEHARLVEAAARYERAAAGLLARSDREWRGAASARWRERNRAARVVWGVLLPSMTWGLAIASVPGFRGFKPPTEEWPDAMTDQKAQAGRERSAAALKAQVVHAARALRGAGFMVEVSQCETGLFFLGRLQDDDGEHWVAVSKWVCDLGLYRAKAGEDDGGDYPAKRLDDTNIVDVGGRAFGHDALMRMLTASTGAGPTGGFMPAECWGGWGGCEAGNCFLSFDDTLALSADDPFAALVERAPIIMAWVRIAAIRRRAWGDRAAGYDADLGVLAALLEQAKRIASPRAEDRTRFVVTGLLPAGKVALLMGEAGGGKSTLALHVGAAIGSGDVVVLGRTIHPEFRGGAIVYLAAEDDDAELCERMGRLAGAGMDAVSVRLVTKRRGMKLVAALQEVRKMPNVAAVVIDPLPAWLPEFRGSEEGERVGALMDELRIFAEETGAAVLGILHPTKPPRRRTVGWMTPSGSQVWVNRARLLLSFEQVPRGAVVTVQKSNLRDAPKGDVLNLSFDPETGMHNPRPGAAAATVRGGAAADPEMLADAVAILPAMARLAADDQKVTRTGKGSLYGRHMHRSDCVPEVDGWPRARCVAAVECGLAAGLFRADPAAGIVPV